MKFKIKVLLRIPIDRLRLFLVGKRIAKDSEIVLFNVIRDRMGNQVINFFHENTLSVHLADYA